MRPADPLLPRVISRSQARAAGLSDRQISHRVARGDWTVLRRGLFLTTGGVPSPADLVELDLLAALGSTRRELVVSHAHAARLWGLPEPLGGWGVPTFLTDGGPDRTRCALTIRASPLQPGEVVVLGSGLMVTDPTRTVLDCLRTLSPANGLAIADAAARRLLAAGDLQAGVIAFKGWPGVRQARRLLRLVDGRRESPLESWSAVAFDDEGLPAPTWQVDLADARGFIGRADAWWANGLAGEADGRAKYRLRAEERGGADAERLVDVLTDEREREKRLRRAGADVVRWGSQDVLRPALTIELARHIRRLLAARRPGLFTGTASLSPVTLPPCTRNGPSEAEFVYRTGGSAAGGGRVRG